MASSNRETFLPVGARKRTHWVYSPRFGPIVCNRFRSFMLFASFSCLSPIGRLFFRWVRASAPTGCSPRDSGRLFAIGSDLYVLDILCSSLLPSSYRETLLPVGARK